MSLKYFKRADIYKNYSGTNRFDCKTRIATSFDWWQYYKVIKGVRVFNSYRYSNTTSKHQRDFKIAMQYNIVNQIDLEIEAPNGLQNLNAAIEHYKYKIDLLKQEIDKPRSHSAKNHERRQLIYKYQCIIEDIKNLLK